jgi:heme/copper-type cytochrome/quinol oxidase subunit 2
MFPWQMRQAVTMSERTTMRLGAGRLGAVLVAVLLFFGAPTARAEDTVTLSIVMQNHQFVPAELHAPVGKPIAIHVKNQNDIVSEFESSDLHFEKIVPSGSEAVVYVRPLQPGRYNFYDDFHHATQGYLVVP